MPDVELADRIASRARPFGVNVPAPAMDALVDYLSLLARWNQRINLTALPLDPPTDAALDRLIVEPLVAASEISAGPASLLDVGSGAGSPAIPLRVMRPDLRLVMVEARARKSAFLRETIRTLGLGDSEVVTSRAEDMGRKTEAKNVFRYISLRGVRLDASLAAGLREVISRDGQVLLFTTMVERPNMPGFSLRRSIHLPGTAQLQLLGLDSD